MRDDRKICYIQERCLTNADKPALAASEEPFAPSRARVILASSPISLIFMLLVYIFLLIYSSPPESPLQHRRQERLQGGDGLRLVAAEGVEQISQNYLIIREQLSRSGILLYRYRHLLSKSAKALFLVPYGLGQIGLQRSHPFSSQHGCQQFGPHANRLWKKPSLCLFLRLRAASSTYRHISLVHDGYKRWQDYRLVLGTRIKLLLPQSVPKHPAAWSSPLPEIPGSQLWPL